MGDGEFLPVAFCLQETHLKKSDIINLKHYSVYSTYVDEDERAAGGSTILVRDNVLHSYVNLNTDLQAVAVRITLDKTQHGCRIGEKLFFRWDPFRRPPFGNLLGDLRVSHGDSSMGDGE
jgi:hypothetical protein